MEHLTTWWAFQACVIWHALMYIPKQQFGICMRHQCNMKTLLCFLRIPPYHCKKCHVLSDSGFHCNVHHSSMLASDNLILQDTTSVCAVCVFPCGQHTIIPEDGCWHSRQHSFWPLATTAASYHIAGRWRCLGLARAQSTWAKIVRGSILAHDIQLFTFCMQW